MVCGNEELEGKETQQEKEETDKVGNEWVGREEKRGLRGKIAGKREAEERRGMKGSKELLEMKEKIGQRGENKGNTKRK